MAAQDSEVDGDEGHLTETDDDSCDGDVGAGGRQPPAIRRRGPARALPQQQQQQQPDANPYPSKGQLMIFVMLASSFRYL